MLRPIQPSPARIAHSRSRTGRCRRTAGTSPPASRRAGGRSGRASSACDTVVVVAPRGVGGDPSAQRRAASRPREAAAGGTDRRDETIARAPTGYARRGSRRSAVRVVEVAHLAGAALGEPAVEEFLARQGARAACSRREESPALVPSRRRAPPLRSRALLLAGADPVAKSVRESRREGGIRRRMIRTRMTDFCRLTGARSGTVLWTAFAGREDGMQERASIAPVDQQPASDGLRPRSEHAPAATLRRYLPLVRRVARRLLNRMVAPADLDDLVSLGTLGLIDALAKYEQGREVLFSTYARFRIRGAILDYLREVDWVPRSVREKAAAVERAARALEAVLGRPAREDELASELGLSLDGLSLPAGADCAGHDDQPGRPRIRKRRARSSGSRRCRSAPQPAVPGAPSSRRRGHSPAPRARAAPAVALLPRGADDAGSRDGARAHGVASIAAAYPGAASHTEQSRCPRRPRENPFKLARRTADGPYEGAWT